MTANGRPGRLVLGSRGIGELDLFARSAGDGLLHVRRAGLGDWTGEELGRATTAPWSGTRRSP